MKVYLFELDSVRNFHSEIMIGQNALYEEIVKNGNTVVLSMNQLTDSRSFLSLLHEEKSFESIIKLFKMGAMKVSLYGNKRTASQYIQEAIQKRVEVESDAFIFSGLPVRCNDSEILHMIRHALQYSDLKRIDDYQKESGIDNEAAVLDKAIHILAAIQLELLSEVQEAAVEKGLI
ncbi:MAG: hypothetical protein PHQ72_09180 [Hespellia sp.]|nr:hypothetical protein [Hespellia sp.]